MGNIRKEMWRAIKTSKQLIQIINLAPKSRKQMFREIKQELLKVILLQITIIFFEFVIIGSVGVAILVVIRLSSFIFSCELTDGILSFLGSVLGGIITMLGVIITLRHNKILDSEHTRQAIRPLLSAELHVPNDSPNAIFIKIINSGNYSALNIEVLFDDFPGFKCKPDNISIGILNAQEASEQIVNFDIDNQKLLHYFSPEKRRDSRELQYFLELFSENLKIPPNAIFLGEYRFRLFLRYQNSNGDYFDQTINYSFFLFNVDKKLCLKIAPGESYQI